jgi:hypothetical protein
VRPDRLDATAIDYAAPGEEVRDSRRHHHRSDADPVEGEPGIVLVALVPVRNRLLEAGKRFTPGIDGR